MFEVIRWVSIVLMWLAVGMNLYAMFRCIRTRKELEAQIELVKAYIEYRKERGDWACVEVGVSDERNDND